jgi:hypothetical protein
VREWNASFDAAHLGTRPGNHTYGADLEDNPEAGFVVPEIGAWNAVTAVGGTSETTAAFFQSRTVTFQAWGFEAFTPDNHDIRPPVPGLADDYKLYKTWTSAGTNRRVPPFTSYYEHWVAGGAQTHPGLVWTGTVWGLGALPTGDTLERYEDGSGCALSGWTFVSSTPGRYEPSFRADVGDGRHWTTTDGLTATRPADCSGAVFSVTLSDPCTWADCYARAQAAAASGTIGPLGNGEGPVASNSADASGGGADDRWAFSMAGRYRLNLSPVPYARRARWKEVTRRNRMRVVPDNTGGYYVTNRTTTLTEPITHPYYDEFGAWSPSDLRWSATAEKQYRYRRDTQGTGNIQLVGPGSFANLVWATRVRGVLADKSEWVSGMKLRLQTGAGNIDLPISADGETPIHEVALAAMTDTDYLYFARVIDAAGTELPKVGFRVLYRQRRRLWIAGHAALDGTSTDLVPIRFRVETVATVRNVQNKAADHWPCVGTATLTTVRAYSAITGLPEWDSATIGTVTVKTGTCNGIVNVFHSHGTGSGLVTTTLTPSERIQSRTLPTNWYLDRPVALDEPDPEGDILAEVERTDVVPANALGADYYVASAVRGASVFLEAATVVRMEP